MINKKCFASDNCASVHEAVMKKLIEVNIGHADSYGDDEYSQSVLRRLETLCGGGKAYFVLSGTGANAACLNAMCPSWGAVICTDLAHINCDETGAPEHLTGAKLFALRGDKNNKLTPDIVRPLLSKIGDQHYSQPTVISITQCTETGTVYTVDEVKKLAQLAHDNRMLLHMDGARLANAIAYLGCSVKEMTSGAGVDALSFGLSKNGGMIGEAVICFANLPQFLFVRKSCTQLVSKNRYIAAQFDAMLENDLWISCAKHANAMAKRLADGLCALRGVSCPSPTEGNEVFVKLPHDAIEPLREFMAFHDADEGVDTVRLVAAFDTTADEVDAFIAKARELIVN
ncbi:MAG: beta-eliminating lyase-related protein [Clostridia bacterium]